MTATITPISEAEFANIEPARRLIAHEYARRFARLELTDNASFFALSWQSDLIEPSMCSDENNVTWVGIDERVAAVGSDGQVLLSIGLASPLLSMASNRNGVLAICELEAIYFNLNCSINSTIDFPSLLEDFNLSDGCLSASFADGSSIEVAI